MKFADERSLSETLSKIFYKSGAKRTDLALNSTLDAFKAASVRSGSKVIILITGGPAAEVSIDSKNSISGTDLLLTPTTEIHKSAIAVYAVGIQEGLSDEESKLLTEHLQIIASKPTADHVFEVSDYDKLKDESEKIANKSCIGKILLIASASFT